MQKLFSQLSDKVFVSPQIHLSDIENIVKTGIKTVICHRPDTELSPYEANFVTLQKTLTKNGINMIYQPIRHITMPDVTALHKLLNESETPVLLYCLSGTRSALLWALCETVVNQRHRNAVLAAAKAAGYDLGGHV